MKEKVADYINTLGTFCGKRDIESLSAENLRNKYGIAQADVMVLFGGSILCGGDVLAQAMKDGVAKKYVIVGGEGHTTMALRQRVHRMYPQISTYRLAEAEVFDQYLQVEYGLKADCLETKSTNCGNNITFLLDLLKKQGIGFNNIILCQDATMQQRMDAGLRKYVSDEKTIINYAAYQAEVTVRNGKLAYQSEIKGMWNMDRYINLLMGEIPRLTDNAKGYGPSGQDYIAHVDIPENIQSAFEELQKVYGRNVREANPLYASR